MTKRFQPDPRESRYPSRGGCQLPVENGRSVGSELPGLGLAEHSGSGEHGNDALVHGELLRLGTNGNASLYPFQVSFQEIPPDLS